MLTKLSAAQAKKMLLYTAQQIMASKDYLTEVDNAIADGDHGIGMYGGMKKAVEKLNTIEPTDVYALFGEMGKAMLMSMGGASGVIFGSMFYAGAKGKEPKEEITCTEFADMMEASLREIKNRGKAEVGDKTMVDALQPAVEAMEAFKGENFVCMLEQAEEAARQGMENTKKYVAKFGRAKTLGERAVGFQDAGATSVHIIFRSMHEFVKSL